jgi:hypothetical protein
VFDETLGAIGDRPDVVGVVVTVSCCPFDIITALNPFPAGVSMIVPVAPTPCTTPLGSMTSRTRDGALQPSPVAVPASHLAA